MGVLKNIQANIEKVGIKEVARRAGLAPSTVSRINSGTTVPSLEVAERISDALGLRLELIRESTIVQAPRLSYAKDVLGRLRNQLKSLGVKHATIYGSVARKEDTENSDIDIYLDFGEKSPNTKKLLKAEGLIYEAFSPNSADVVSDLSSDKGQRLKLQIDQDGVNVF